MREKRVQSQTDSRKILLYGPIIGDLKGAYGGGTGGYTRKMGLYLNHFHSENIQIIPCFHTVRGQFRFGFFPLRFVLDIWYLLRDLIRYRPDGVHVLAQYRKAIPREAALITLCRLFRTPVIYEIKAGVFVHWYKITNSVFRRMTRYCLRHARIILCQGMPYVEFLRDSLGIESRYHPNFVPAAEISPSVSEKLTNFPLKVLFVGYAFADKGVYELTEGCRIAAQEIPVELNLVGQEHPEFTTWLDDFESGPQLTINRIGRLPHSEVLDQYAQNDIYLYPTRHPGEGHNNSINEAMMAGLVVITTRQGFMGSILNERIAHFLSEITPEAIAEALLRFGRNPEEGQRMSREVRQHFMDNFTGDIIFRKLESYYLEL